MIEVFLTIINAGFIRGVYGYFLLAVFAIFVYPVLKRKTIIMRSLGIGTFPFWILVITGIIYSRCVIGTHNRIITYCALPILGFMTGYYITNSNSNSNRALRAAERCLCAIAFGCGIHVLLNISVNLGVTRQNTADYFTGILAATNLGSLNTFIFALLPCLMVTRRRKVRIIGLCLFALSTVYMFILGTRTQLYAFIITLVFSTLIYFRRHYPKGIPQKTLVKWVLVAALLTVTVLVVYKTNIGSIRTKILMSNLLFRFSDVATSVSDSSRVNFFWKGITNLFKYPLGGNHVTGLSYFHNYWLDVGRVAGMIPVILLVIMDFIFIKHMFRLLKNTSIDEDFRYAIMGIYICVFLNFFVEPIMDGYLDLFYRFTFVNGLVEGLYERTSYKEKRFYTVRKEDNLSMDIY